MPFLFYVCSNKVSLWGCYSRCVFKFFSATFGVLSGLHITGTNQALRLWSALNVSVLLGFSCSGQFLQVKICSLLSREHWWCWLRLAAGVLGLNSVGLHPCSWLCQVSKSRASGSIYLEYKMSHHLLGPGRGCAIGFLKVIRRLNFCEFNLWLLGWPYLKFQFSKPKTVTRQFHKIWLKYYRIIF